MKKFLMMILLMVMTYVSPINAITTDDTPRIEIIKIGLPSTICIEQSDTFAIRIQTKYNYIYQDIKYEVNDSTLKIWLDNNYRYEDMYNLDNTKTKITIMIPNDVEIKTLNQNLSINSKSNKMIKMVSKDEN